MKNIKQIFLRDKARLFAGVVSLFATALYLFVATSVQATNPGIISFQGKVVNADGTNVTNGSYNFDFVMYDDVTLGTPSDGVHDKWHELTKSVAVTNGVFQTNLGSATALPDFNANPSLYLAVRFNADAAGYMSPRVQMASVPYAANADKVGGVAASSIVQLGATQSGNINISSGTLTSGLINGQTISTSANFTGTLTVQGASATFGTASQAGSLVLYDNDSGGETVTLNGGAISGSYSLTLPTAAGSTSQCLQTDSVTASQLIFSTCGGGGSGDSISVNSSAATDANFLNTAATSTVAGTTFALNTVSTPDDITLTVSNASATLAGVITATAQTIGGAKTFANGISVGSLTNRQDSSFYGDVTKEALVNKVGLTGISDIFVYDSTRDSDAGKWTRSDSSRGLSWYTETADNTAAACVIASDDRCGQAPFPRKAIIVATDTAVYIFDNDDNTMWMKFTQAGTFSLGGDTNNNPSSVFALNGVIYVGTNGASSTGMYALDFTQDRMYRYNATDRNQSDKNMANRNTTVTYNVESRTALKFIGAGGAQVNDVSGAVISGSTSILTNGGPLNGGTFICAATDDGIQVVNVTSGITIPYGDGNITDQFSACVVTKRARLYGLNVTQLELQRWGTNSASSLLQIDTATAVPATGVTTPFRIWDENAGITTPPNLFKTAQAMAIKPDTLEVIERASAADEKADLIYVGHAGGLTEIHDLENPVSPTFGWSKFYNTSFSTPLMTGTPRGMFPFNEISGTSVADATVRNSVLAIKGTTTNMFGLDGVHGTGLKFDNATTYLCSDQNADATCDTDTDFNVGLLSSTVSAWFKHSTSAPPAAGDVLVDRRYTALAGAEGIGYTIEMNTTGQIVYGIQDTAATAAYDFSVTSSQSFNDGLWHHVAAINNDTNLALYIDGRLATPISASVAALTTLDASQILTIGADASGASGGNFWDGSIDDVYFSGNGATTSDTLSQAQVRKVYLEGRAALTQPSATFVDATTVSGTTIGDSAAVWIPNSFTGGIVEITGGTGVGQTRRIISNTGTVFTVSPAFTVTPDTTSDFEVMPEQLYGASNIVYAIGTTDNAFLGDSRRLFVGTNDGSDGGGVTVFEGNGTAYATDNFHAGAGITDDTGAAWTGTDFDDTQSIGTNGTSLVMGSMAHFWTETDQLDFQVTLDTLANRIYSIRSELVVDGLNGTSLEIGGLGGADLAENYSSDDDLHAGEIVTMEPNNPGRVKRAAKAYDNNMLGIVATAPGFVLGAQDDHSYPVALVGRVPVLVTTENGPIASGDRITSAATSGYAMKAVQSGRVLGTTLEELTADKYIECPAGMKEGVHCGQITVFVNLVDYNGASVDMAISDQGIDMQGLADVWEPITGMFDLGDSQVADGLSKSSRILRYLAGRKAQINGKTQSEILTDRVSAVELIADNTYSQNGYAVNFAVDKLRANKIEGLELFTVNGSAEFKGSAMFRGLVTFVEKTIFSNDITFNGRTTFNNDTAGFAVIKKDQQEVKVAFDKSYEQNPVVTMTVKNGQFAQFTYKDLTKEGFTIVLKDPAASDIEFAWTALSIKDAKTTGNPITTLVNQ